jgi:hypothetical protein
MPISLYSETSLTSADRAIHRVHLPNTRSEEALFDSRRRNRPRRREEEGPRFRSKEGCLLPPACRCGNPLGDLSIDGTEPPSFKTPSSLTSSRLEPHTLQERASTWPSTRSRKARSSLNSTMAAKAHKPSSTSMIMGSCNLVSVLRCMRFFIP